MLTQNDILQASEEWCKKKRFAKLYAEAPEGARARLGLSCWWNLHRAELSPEEKWEYACRAADADFNLTENDCRYLAENFPCTKGRQRYKVFLIFIKGCYSSTAERLMGRCSDYLDRLSGPFAELGRETMMNLKAGIVDVRVASCLGFALCQGVEGEIRMAYIFSRGAYGQYQNTVLAERWKTVAQKDPDYSLDAEKFSRVWTEPLAFDAETLCAVLADACEDGWMKSFVKGASAGVRKVLALDSWFRAHGMEDEAILDTYYDTRYYVEHTELTNLDVENLLATAKEESWRAHYERLKEYVWTKPLRTKERMLADINYYLFLCAANERDMVEQSKAAVLAEGTWIFALEQLWMAILGDASCQGLLGDIGGIGVGNFRLCGACRPRLLARRVYRDKSCAGQCESQYYAWRR